MGWQRHQRTAAVTLLDTRTNILRVCTLEGRIISLKQDENILYCKVVWPTKIRPGQFTNRKDENAAILSEEQLMLQSTNSIITDYLQLEPNAIELYEKWSAVDPNFKKKASNFAGLS